LGEVAEREKEKAAGGFEAGEDVFKTVGWLWERVRLHSRKKKIEGGGSKGPRVPDDTGERKRKSEIEGKTKSIIVIGEVNGAVRWAFITFKKAR